MASTVPLTAAQRTQVGRLLPDVLRWAAKYNADDEYASIAMLALCELVPRYRADLGVSLRTYVYRELRLRWRRYWSRQQEVTGWDMDSLPYPPREDAPEKPRGVRHARDIGIEEGITRGAVLKRRVRARKIIREMQDVPGSVA